VKQDVQQADAPAYRATVEAENAKITGAARRRRWSLPGRLLAALFACLFVLVCLAGLLTARLAAGPISLDWLVPLAESALSKQDDSLNIQLQQAALTWREWSEGPTLSLDNARVAAADGSFRAAIDHLSASVSAQSLLAGQPVPRRLQASGIRASVVLPPAAAAPDDGGQPPSLQSMIDTSPLRFIETITIDDAAVAIASADGQVDWRGRIDSLTLQNGSAGLEGHAALTLDQGGTSGAVTLAARIDAATNVTSATVEFDTLRLAALAPLSTALAPLSVLDLPLSGTAAASLGGDGSLQTVSLSASGEAGRFRLTPELAAYFGIDAAAAQTIPVRSLSLQLAGQPAADDWRLEALRLQLPDTARVVVPAPVGKSFPLRQIVATATLKGGRLTVPNLTIDLDRPRFVLTADLADVTTAPRGDVQLQIRNATVQDVRAYWPPQMAANAFQWVDTHLQAGSIADARMHMTLGSENGGTTVTALQLTIPIEGAVVDYLAPLPAVREGQVVVGLDLQSLTVTIRQARVDGLRVSDGRVSIPDFNLDTPTIDIEFTTGGGLADLVALLATKPLEFVPTKLIQPDNFGGRFEARVRLNFPLIDDLDVDEIKVAVAAATKGASISLPAKGVSVTDVDLDFSVSETGLHANGPLRIDGVNGVLDWIEDFQDTTALRRRIDFRIAKAEVAAVRAGVKPMLSLDRYLIGGRFAGVLQYTERDGSDAQLDARLELSQAEIAIPELRWHKPIGQAASAQAEVVLAGGRLDAIRNVRLTGGDVDVQGYALFTPSGELRSASIDPFVLGRTHLKAAIIGVDGKGWDITVSGPSLDVSPFLAEESGHAERAPAKGPGPDVLLSVDLKQVWIEGDTPLEDVLVSAKRADGAWRSLQVRGQVGADAPFSVDVQPLEDNVSTIAISAQNAGATLAALGQDMNIRGGRLSGQAIGVLSADALRLTGEVRIDRFYLVGAPLVARMLDILAVTGLREILTGRGISFSTLRLPFEVRDGAIELKSARASGASLGMTASGTIDLDNDLVQMNGVLVPFFWANNALGRLPIIGSWLTGGQDGGGIFSASYQVSGQLADPKLRVNAYSIFLPSVIRALLGWIQGWIGPQANSQAVTAPATP
jgi:Predicted membrane protein